MLKRLADMSIEFAGLLETKARVVARDFEQVGVRLGAYFGAMLCGLIGLGLLLAATVVFLQTEIGIAGALGAVGGLTLVLAGVILLVARGTKKTRLPSQEQLEFEAARLRERMKSRATQTAKSEEHPWASVASKAVSSLMDDPKVLASGVFAALAVLGPRRVLRMLADTATVARLTTSAARIVQDLSAQAASSAAAAAAAASAARAEEASANAHRDPLRRYP